VSGSSRRTDKIRKRAEPGLMAGGTDARFGLFFVTTTTNNFKRRRTNDKKSREGKHR